MFFKPIRIEWRTIRADESSADSAVNKNCLGKMPAIDPEARLRQFSEVALLQFTRRGLFDRGRGPPPEPSGDVISRDKNEVPLPLLDGRGCIYH